MAEFNYNEAGGFTGKAALVSQCEQDLEEAKKYCDECNNQPFCKICGTDVADKALELINEQKAKIAERDERITYLTDVIENLESQNNQLRKAADSHNCQVKDLDATVSKLITEKESSNRDYEKLQRMFNSLVFHFLGNDFYIVDPVGGMQANEICFKEIMAAYPKNKHWWRNKA